MVEKLVSVDGMVDIMEKVIWFVDNVKKYLQKFAISFCQVVRREYYF